MLPVPAACGHSDGIDHAEPRSAHARDRRIATDSPEGGILGLLSCPTPKYLDSNISTSSEELPGTILVWAWTRQGLGMVNSVS
jgi:hypothetical protein